MNIFKSFYEEVIKPTAEDFKDLKQEIRNDTRQLKNDLLDIVEEESELVANTLRTANRVSDTVKNKVDAHKPGNIAKEIFQEDDDYKRGDHLKVLRLFPTRYTHHGLYIGNDQVIHYAEGSVHVASIEKFKDGSRIELVESPILYSVDNVIRRARSRMAEGEYNLIINNCEHFVNWCRSGN